MGGVDFDFPQMSQEEIGQSYDSLAGHWNGDQFNRENGLEAHERAVRFVASRGRAIDIGCGSSGRLIELLLSKGFEVEGLDISERMIELARARHPEVIFHLADIVTWELPRKYDLISAWDSIWHVPLEFQELVFRKLCAGLAKEGVLIFTTGGVDEPEEASNPFLDQPLYHAALGIPRLSEVVLEMGCVCRHLEYDEARGEEAGKHVYFVVQKLS